MADREETNKSATGDKEETTASPANVTEEESSASEYEEIIEEVTDYSEEESDSKDTNSNKVNVEKSQIKQTPSEVAADKCKAVTTRSEISSVKQEVSAKVQVSETETKTVTQTKTKTETVEVEESSTSETEIENKNTNDAVDKTDSSAEGESKKPTVHDTHKLPQHLPQEGKQSANNQKLKSAQTNNNNYNNANLTGDTQSTASSENSSMHIQYNTINRAQQQSNPTVPNSSQNPILTVQTAGRADSTSKYSNNSNNNNNSSSCNMNNTKISSNNNHDSVSSNLGGNFVVVGDSDSPRQVDRLGVPQKEDSGTESGEDLRLIAAGLRDQLQIQSDSNIIEDVTCALNRLENSLKEGKGISVDTEKRKALLALVARLRAGLTSPEKLAEIAAAMSELDGGEGPYGETSSPEADAHRSNRSRFAKRRNRVNRHTVGVSREELADARRYMEDMLIMGNLTQNVTPEANNANPNTPPQWNPLAKNASMGAILSQTSAPVLQRPKQFVPEDNSALKYTNKLTVNSKRRPLSGEYSVTFEKTTLYDEEGPQSKETEHNVKQSSPPEDNSKFSRFSNKKQLMKRANTIDLAKSHKYNSELDTDSDAEDKGPHLGLKRTVQVSVKKRVQNVVPPFEPKTENDRKFLAFINKQSDKPGLGWNSSRSVSNWTNKFGSIKSTFEGGLTSKPPQAPHHVPSSKQYQSSKLFSQPVANTSAPPPNYLSNQQIALRLQQEADRQAEERRRKLEKERLEYERRERDKLERQRQQRERQERERLEREHFERQRREQDQIAAAQHAAILREQAANMNVPKPIPINEFKHAPQSVFRPIDSVDSPTKPIYKPIPQLPRNSNNWRSFNAGSPRGYGSTLSTTSPNQHGNTRPDDSFITSPPPSSRSPIGVPWASKPTVGSSSFKSKANRFEERSKYDNVGNSGPYLQRHNSLRSSNDKTNEIAGDFRKRPSLPNTSDPLAYLPPPQNISFTYSNVRPKANYQSYPCLPTAIANNNSDSEYQRSREDSLTDPHAVPLVLTSANPSYCPTATVVSQQQQQQPHHQNQLNQPHLPRQFDLASPAGSTPASPSVYTMPQTDCTDDDLDSDNNLLEYHAVSRVMRKPQSQTAVTVGRRTGHVSDDELYGKNSHAARNLLTTMKSLGNNSANGKSKAPMTKQRSETAASPKLCLSQDGRSYQAPVVEPLFPDINKFEANRSPLHTDQSKQQQTSAPSYPHAKPRKQPSMYKSLENLNRAQPNYTSTTQQSSPKPFVKETQPPNRTNFVATTQQRSPKPYVNESQPTNFGSFMTTTQQPSIKPYVSETQSSYVVTYPIDDTTDDEDFSSHNQNKKVPPQSLDLRRQRHISENSTGSSTTASVTYSHNLPSPNTSWTSNPIVADESSNNQPVPPQYHTPRQNLQNSPSDPSYQPNNQVPTNYSSINQSQNYVPPPTDYLKKAAQYEAPPQRNLPPITNPSLHQQNLTQQSQHDSMQRTMPTSKSVYEAQSQRYLQQQQLQQTVNQNHTSKSTAEQQKQYPPERTQKLSVAQKSVDYSKSTQPTKQFSKTVTSTTATQEKRTLSNIRKTVSEDHQHSLRDQSNINPQSSNISQEMLIRLEQQRERISNETRRKSLGNTSDYQTEKEARYETQKSQEYKSSAPADTPDIVKSSLPKDENQPILKKFGPPQRHHYMPNAYQSPRANTVSTSSVVTTTQSTKIRNKVEQTMKTTSSNKTVVKTSQDTLTHAKPTVMETPATPQPDDDYIPRNIVYNNVHAFSSMSRRQDYDEGSVPQEQYTQIRPNKLSKSDSWNQIIMLQNQNNQTHSTKFPPSPTNELRRTKSGHTLAIPKMYEAAMTKTDISEKQKTVAAYFSGKKSPTQQEVVVEQRQQTKRSVINRTKTSEKVSAASRKSLGSNPPIVPGSITRSATMPHIANISLLDESNVEDAFEQLIMEQKQQKAASSTTEKTETKEKDGAVVTTTTRVTTRTITGSAPKPVSPFSKFKQLDKENSQQSTKSPTTPTTPGGGSTASPSAGAQPIFKFTDPALNARAATVKDQLLQWCQSKTQEYENVEITNFSTSWNNGLAFCALIHHFLPDAFDYSQLTPKNRRKNFELAFTVADEKAGIAPLLDVEDMVVMQRPDWKSVFVYVQSIYRRFRNCQ